VKHLPDYMLRRLAAPGGTRLSKFKPYLSVTQSRRIWPADNRPCDVCGKQVLMKNIHGAESLDGHYRGRNYYHNDCFSQIPGGWRTESEKPSKGNLENADYRFWIGTRHAASASMSWGMCRCCRISTHSNIERYKHLNDDSCAVGGERCAQRLIEAYKQMLASVLCVVCKNPRHGRSTWGIPLCGQQNCLQAWMFSHDRYVSLEAILMAQKKKAEFMQKKAGVKVSYTASGSVVPIANWCLTCKMRTDQMGHAEIHARWAEMGLAD
jgi:hypothetical protein